MKCLNSWGKVEQEPRLRPGIKVKLTGILIERQIDRWDCMCPLMRKRGKNKKCLGTTEDALKSKSWRKQTSFRIKFPIQNQLCGFWFWSWISHRALMNSRYIGIFWNIDNISTHFFDINIDRILIRKFWKFGYQQKYW